MMDEGTYGRHGLGSSSSWLDGVPFKIGPKFRPPPKVIYQPTIECSSKNPKEEYTFETEEAVLAWAKAREEALKKASIEQAEKALKNNLSVKKNGEVEIPDSESNEGNASNIKDGNNSVPSDTVANFKAEAKPPQVAVKPMVPKKLHEPGAILKPTPIQHKATNQNENESAAKSPANSILDVSMFESVADPFDTLELQTIDDMEELKVLLDSASSNGLKKEFSEQSKSENNASDSKINADSNEGFYDLAAPVSRDNWVKFEDNTFSNSNEIQTKMNESQEPVTRSSESPASDDIGDYVDISEEACLNPKAMTGTVDMRNSEPTNSNSNALPGSSMPNLDSAKGIYKPVLPPIPHNHMKVLNGESETQDKNASQPMAFTAAVSMNTSSYSVSFSNEPFPPAPTNSKPDIPKPARVAPLPPPLVNRTVPTPSPRNLGQTSSSPRQSVSNSLELNSSSTVQPISNPYSRHNTNSSHSDAYGNSQISNACIRNGPSQSPVNQLNRYNPLPPAPFPKPKEIGLTDPYHSLSRESQEFVDRVTSMGFLRAKVARAVEKFGQDEKEVLDHLFAVDLLVEKKYAPVHAEAALKSCKNDLEKAEDFLKLQAQLEQLGFSSETVRNALISSDMDHDKALDILTA